MSPTDSFDEFVRRLAAGDEGAAFALFQRYAGRLVALARSRIDPRLKARVDPEDAVQSALRSFFVRCRAGQFELHDPNRLWALLVTMTLRKCYRQAEWNFTGGRDPGREARVEPGEDGEAEEFGVSREPTPEEAAVLTETVEEVMRRLDTPLKRRVFELALQGLSASEIASEVGYYERGVDRARREVRQLLVKMAQE